jgi:uncharacterized protein
MGSTAIGEVEAVSPVEIRVSLDLDAPQATALNTGSPTPFPQLNSYLVVPVGTGLVVGLVTWIGVERSQFPKRSGLKDFGLIDLPYPTRKLSLTPIGTLRRLSNLGGSSTSFDMERGLSIFPSIGDSVHLPTPDQLRAIVETRADGARVEIGISPMAANARVSVDPDRLFGRHLAVLGNTGSGKSCTVAGLIRWSLEAAERIRIDLGRPPQPDARFIVLDPNGEYARAFSDLTAGVRVFQVPPGVADGCNEFTLPAWMWNSHEWAAFTEAAPRAQRPLVLRALRELRGGAFEGTVEEAEAARTIRIIRRWLVVTRSEGKYTEYRDYMNIRTVLDRWKEDADRYAEKLDGGAKAALEKFVSDIAGTITKRTNDRGYAEAFNDTDFATLLEQVDVTLGELPDEPDLRDATEDAPIPFDVTGFANHLDLLASTAMSSGATFVDSLTMRIRTMLSDSRKRQVLIPDHEIDFGEWLDAHVGNHGSYNGSVSVIDLSLVPQDVMHMVVSVMARVVFESIQRYRRLEHQTYPTVLVLEEAHSFIQRGSDGEDGIPRPDQICRQVFERIAREGRKFGLGLVLSSQRPSELSPTILSQCNTFLLHRIVNDRDQDLVGRLVPDNVAGLLKELPSLPSRQAILLGWATPIPVLVEINELEPAHRPQSDDPDFWNAWIGEAPRAGRWKEVADEWQGKVPPNDSTEPPSRSDLV